MNPKNDRSRTSRDLRNLVGVLMGVGAASAAMAQTVPTTITVDSSFGRTPGQIGASATNTTVTGNRGATYNVNNLYTIAEARGRTAGANLFHSFGTFNVGAGDAAVFTTTTASLQNIIARVSGPTASTIQGLLAVNAAADSAPNLFLINPAGVTFGAGAQVDVPAAFHVSTANELRFADGTVYKAGAGPDSAMTMAAPEAFGFIGGSGNITFTGVQAENDTSFVATSLDLTAAGVTFEDSSIAVPQARVRIVGTGPMPNRIPIEGEAATALQGEVRLTRSSLDVSTDPNADLLEDFPLDDFPTDDFPSDELPADIPTDILDAAAPTTDAGSITLLSGSVFLDDSTLRASVDAGSGSAGTLRIRAAGDVLLNGGNNLAAEIGENVLNGRTGTIDVVAQGALSIGADGGATFISTRSESVTPSSSSGGVALQGQSVAVSNTIIDATAAMTGTLIGPVVPTAGGSTGPQASPISILSGSSITLDETQIFANSFAQQDIRAGAITLRSSNGGDIVLMNSSLQNGSFFGRSGAIQLDTTGNVQLFNSTISAAGFGGSTGAIDVRGNEIALNGASEITVDSVAFDVTGLDIDAPTDARIGSITLEATSRVVVDVDATISARSSGTAAADTITRTNSLPPGQIRINTPRIELDGAITTETSNFNASNILLDGGNGGLTVQGTGVVTSSTTIRAVDDSRETPATGNAGTITLLGQDIDVRGVLLQSASDGSSLGDAGSIQVAAVNDLQVSGAQLQTNTGGAGKAGNIALSARTARIDSSQIQSQASIDSSDSMQTAASGQTGTITLQASQALSINDTTVSIANDALVSDPGVVTQGKIGVDAPTLTLKNSTITAASSQNVLASAIAVTATSGVTLDTTSISSSATGTAAAGDIAISSNGVVALTNSSITGDALAAKTSQLTVTGSQVRLDGASRLSTSLLGGPTTTSGGVGAVRVTGTDKITLSTGSSIDARTVGSFDNPAQATPGEVRLTTPRLEVDGTITTETLGNVAASNIFIGTDGAFTVTGSGVLNSSTSGSGNAGNIDIGGNATTLNGVMVNSASTGGSSGNAGTVTLRAARALAIENATVRTDTAGSGKAGNIALTADTITIDPSLISSQAASGSSGQTGTIDVSASNSVELRDSTLSIANAARVADPSMTPLGQIRLGAPVVKLFNSNLTAQSSENVAASGIAVTAERLTARNSNITTSARDGNGGSIAVTGQRFTVLDRSQISTSVLGTQSGSGGDIQVRANVLVLRNGFIQANTAAAGANGGNVVIGVGQLLPVGALITGGNAPLQFDPLRNGLNAIQAAAPDGVSGNIQFTGPSLDVVGNLQNVEAEFVATGPLGQDLCKRGSSSSLTQVGRGGLRPLSSGLMRPDTSLPLLPDLPALSLRLETQAPSTGKCGH